MAVGSSMLATIRTAPPQWAQVVMSMEKTRLSRCAQLIARRFCSGLRGSSWALASTGAASPAGRLPRPDGVSCARRFAFGANTPWNRVKCARGGGLGRLHHQDGALRGLAARAISRRADRRRAPWEALAINVNRFAEHSLRTPRPLERLRSRYLARHQAQFESSCTIRRPDMLDQHDGRFERDRFRPNRGSVTLEHRLGATGGACGLCLAVKALWAMSPG